MTKSTLELVGVIENLKTAVEGARARGIPVLYGPMAYTEEDYKEHQLPRRSSINRVMFERKMFSRFLRHRLPPRPAAARGRHRAAAPQDL